MCLVNLWGADGQSEVRALSRHNPTIPRSPAQQMNLRRRPTGPHFHPGYMRLLVRAMVYMRSPKAGTYGFSSILYSLRTKSELLLAPDEPPVSMMGYRRCASAVDSSQGNARAQQRVSVGRGDVRARSAELAEARRYRTANGARCACVSMCPPPPGGRHKRTHRGRGGRARAVWCRLEVQRRGSHRPGKRRVWRERAGLECDAGPTRRWWISQISASDTQSRDAAGFVAVVRSRPWMSGEGWEKSGWTAKCRKN